MTDSKQNLLDAFTYVCDDRSSGVSIVFNGSVILGTRAKKVRSKSFSAFASINYPELAVLQDGRVLHYIDLGYRERAKFSHKLNDSVGLVKLIPGTDAGMLSYALDRYDAVIIESFGVGGLPEGTNGCFRSVIDRGVKAGKLIVEGVLVATVHQKPRRQGEDGGIIKRETPIYASKVMLVCPKCGKPTRVGHAFADGKKFRACKKCGASF